ncbi:MAG: gamma-glutamylcyclotransferase family protein [Planctomycetota bacterium]
MSDRAVWTFFYGSYLNPAVLAEVDLRPQVWETARLGGFELVISPRANLRPASGCVAFGIVAQVTHAELDRLYAHAEDVLGQVYLPEAVLVSTFDHRSLPALCYVCTDMAPAPAEADYVDRILEPCRQYGFPEWYLKHIASFRPS